MGENVTLRVELDRHRGRAQALMKEVVSPLAARIDADGLYPNEIFERFAAEGFLALSLPEQLGGSGLGVRGLTIATEEAAQVSSAAGLMLLLTRLPAAPILAAGSREQTEEWLIPLGRGERRGSFALSEPSSGSDPLGMACSARPVPGGWELHGTKAWVSGAEEADWFVVVATTHPGERRPDSVRAFVVDADTPGLSVHLHQRAGGRGVSLGDVALDKVFVPDARRLPGVNGMAPLLTALATMRPVISARGTGLAAGALMLAAERMSSRLVGGKALEGRQGLQWKLADLVTRLESAQLLTERAAELVDAGQSGPAVAGRLAMAKLASSELAIDAAQFAAQVHGAEGCVLGHPADRYVRDARQLTIVEGTSEIQRNVIANSVVHRQTWWRSDAEAKDVVA
jgi:alkylation response protein AidB-like acyl-CoA dehydrogenase